MKTFLFFVAVFVLSIFPLNGKTHTVSSASQIDSVCKFVAAGDTIMMSDGTWTNQVILFKATGSANKPIILRAQTNQSILLTGTSTLRIAGNYLMVDGLRFENGYSPSGAVIEFRGTDGTESSYCRLTRTSIKSYNPVSISTDYKWVSLYGQYNRVDHCAFENKTHLGTTLVVWLPASKIPNYHQIDHNYFGPRPLLVDTNGVSVNGGETIRVGTSDYSMNDSYTTVEYNYFDRCNGEIEVISSKSCGNTYRFNVFASCQGMLTLRHGNRCNVYGNYFFCNNALNSGGIRIIGEDHKVYNNYIEKSSGSSMKTGITFVNGVLNSPLNRYFQVKRAQVVFNTLVDNRYSIHIGAGKDSELTLPPLDCTIANNLVWSTKEQLITYTDIPVNMKYEGNIFYGSALGITNPDGISVTNPQMIFAGDSLWRISSSSPAVNAAAGSYPFVVADMDGQTRSGLFDVGADEYSNEPVVQRPIRKNEVGPASVVTSVNFRSETRMQPTSFTVLRSYPNPFNPETTIEFSIPVSAFAALTIYNGIGEAVALLFKGNAEKNTIFKRTFNGSPYASGMYYAELQYNGVTTIRKMLLLK